MHCRITMHQVRKLGPRHCGENSYPPSPAFQTDHITLQCPLNWVDELKRMHLRLPLVLTSLLCATGIHAAQDPNDVSVLIKEAARANNESLLWGPYKPNLYFGVRPRIANSLAAGLMWGKVDNYATAQQSMFWFWFCLLSFSSQVANADCWY